MVIYVLILMMSRHNGVSVTTHEFLSENSCVAAAKAVQESQREMSNTIKAVCAKK